MKTFLIDTDKKSLMPLTFSRPTCDLLIGIDTIREKWQSLLGIQCFHLSASYMVEFSGFDEQNLLISGGCIPSIELIGAINALGGNEVLTYRGKFVAAKTDKEEAISIRSKIENLEHLSFTDFDKSEVNFNEELMLIETPSDIFALNGDTIKSDFSRITKNIVTTAFADDVSAKGDQIFIEEGAQLSNCVLNASGGPIYIGKNAEVMEGALIRGPFSLGEHSTVKMGAKIYGDTSIGKHCKVGGEIGNSIIHDYSNKGHDGYLGNSVIGSWCNLGADTNTSNLMNTYGEVKVWDYSKEAISPTGRQFYGLVMGDHSKCSINTMFNTGAVVGMCANIFGGGFPAKFVPSFSWGTPDSGFSEFRMDKAIETAKAMMNRRGIEFGQADKNIFDFVQEYDRKYRK
ncbi:MAG: glucose-1-phosphate thymidylyltransferase [Flavobacteriales bacterium]|nr:glucose-1-phosphate thymidylyltransferase [Flavobacteriales bacterium]